MVNYTNNKMWKQELQKDFKSDIAMPVLLRLFTEVTITVHW